MAKIHQLLARLEGDPWRKTNPFSEEIREACEVLLNPYARDDERRKMINAWVAKFQPCVFGQVAARSEGLFISIIDSDMLKRGDKAIKEKLCEDKRTWKQWSLSQKGRHGFLIAVLSPELNFAAPNRALKDFAEHIRSLFSKDAKKDAVGNDVAYECLYLKNPETEEIYKFRVILDFFAAAGDGRWWHDHRFPGGIAFTFNSLGHLAKTRQWYERNSNPLEMSAKMAMHTIANAYQHPAHGKATWLVDLNGKPPMKPMECPFSNPENLKGDIKGKDWTTYQGFHHTDHSIRAEFFDGSDAPDRSRGPFLLDFSYISGNGSGENVELMEGNVVPLKSVIRDIGKFEEWRFAKPLAKAGIKKIPSRPQNEAAKISSALKRADAWLRTRVRMK